MRAETRHTSPLSAKGSATFRVKESKNRYDTKQQTKKDKKPSLPIDARWKRKACGHVTTSLAAHAPNEKAFIRQWTLNECGNVPVDANVTATEARLGKVRGNPGACSLPTYHLCFSRHVLSHTWRYFILSLLA